MDVYETEDMRAWECLCAGRVAGIKRLPVNKNWRWEAFPEIKTNVED